MLFSDPNQSAMDTLFTQHLRHDTGTVGDKEPSKFPRSTR